MKKYTLTKTTKEYFGTTLYQIKALKDFNNVSKGDLGGYIEKEENLSQENNAWVYGNALVSGDAEVSGDARVYGKLKLLSGYFFGYRQKEEKIKFTEIDDSYELISKGEIKLGEEEPEIKEVTMDEVAEKFGIDVKSLKIKK